MFVIVFGEETYSCVRVIPSLIVVVNKGGGGEVKDGDAVSFYKKVFNGRME